MLDPDLPKNIIDTARNAARQFVDLLLPDLPAQAPPGSTVAVQEPGGGTITRVSLYPLWVAPTGSIFAEFHCPTGYTLRNVVYGEAVNGYSCHLNAGPETPKPSPAAVRYV